MYELFSWKWNDYDDYQRKYSYQSNPEAAMNRNIFGSWLEGVGVLVKRKLIDPSFIDDLISGPIIVYWEKFKPIFIEGRKRMNYPMWGEGTEYLYDQVKPIADKEHPEYTKKKIIPPSADVDRMA